MDTFSALPRRVYLGPLVLSQNDLVEGAATLPQLPSTHDILFIALQTNAVRSQFHSFNWRNCLVFFQPQTLFSETPNQTPRLFFRHLNTRNYGTSSPTTVPSALPTPATSNLSRFSRANSSAFTCTTPPRRPRASSQPRRS